MPPAPAPSAWPALKQGRSCGCSRAAATSSIRPAWTREWRHGRGGGQVWCRGVRGWRLAPQASSSSRSPCEARRGCVGGLRGACYCQPAVAVQAHTPGPPPIVTPRVHCLPLSARRPPCLRAIVSARAHTSFASHLPCLALRPPLRCLAAAAAAAPPAGCPAVRRAPTAVPWRCPPGWWRRCCTTRRRRRRCSCRARRRRPGSSGSSSSSNRTDSIGRHLSRRVVCVLHTYLPSARMVLSRCDGAM